MTTGTEHKIVPAIRDWLAATSDSEIPIGLSREEARRRAGQFLASIVVDTLVPNQVDVDDDLKDVLWASVEALDRKPLGQKTFAKCDRFYHFVAALRMENDSFNERDEVLHRVARIGWRSSPGGLEAALKARAAIWEHGDERRHREVCETADQLSNRIEVFKHQPSAEVASIRDTCARVIKLASVRPVLVVSAVAELMALLPSLVRQLDESEYLTAALALAGGMSERMLGNVDASELQYLRAARHFGRTADRTELDRVEVERLAVQTAREYCGPVAKAVADRIRRVSRPRERIKAQLLLAQALLNEGRPDEARSLLDSIRGDPTLENEPALKAWLLTNLGMALSCLAENDGAMARFNAAGAVLSRFWYPQQLASLLGGVGEHLRRLGNPGDAVALYKVAQDLYSESSQPMLGYYRVLLAELLIVLGRIDEARAELLAALPIIQKFDLRREAVAALVLLRQALAKHSSDVTAIREVREELRKGLQS